MKKFKHEILFKYCFVLILLISGCSKNSQNTGSSNLKIGDSYQSGIVAYLFKVGDNGYSRGFKGILVAEKDLSSRYIWKTVCPIDIFSTLSLDIGFGDLNTKKILELTKSYNFTAPAAEEATKYSGGNYNDWFLPSEKELLAIKENLASKGIGNFETVRIEGILNSTYYWSSSVMSNLVGAESISLAPNLGICGCSYAESYSVRPIRYFK